MNRSKGRNTNFHVYQFKTDRSYKVIHREICPKAITNKITEERNQCHHSVRNGTVKRDIKQPLPLFAIELEANNTNKDIYITQKNRRGQV